MNKTRMELYVFFANKAKHLQNEIDLEIEKIGGEGMLISREDLIHWVYDSRKQIETYHTVCQMLENDEGNEAVRRELLNTLTVDQREINRLQARRAQEDAALQQLQREALLYSRTIEELAQDRESTSTGERS